MRDRATMDLVRELRDASYREACLEIALDAISPRRFETRAGREVISLASEHMAACRECNRLEGELILALMEDGERESSRP